MAIKDLLVAYDGNENAKRAVQFAVQMADKYGATITGLHVYKPKEYESQYRRWIPESVLKNIQEAELSAEKSIGDDFHDQIKAAGAKTKAKWISCEGRADVLMPRYARYFDLLIAGQFRGVDQSGGGSLNAEELLLRSGKPIIAVPASYEPQPFKEEAAVAWDGSRAAARALTDAMQILETKKRLDVIRLIDDEEDEEKRVLPEHDLIAHLTAHGINANLVQLKASKRNAGRTILDHCAQTNPDLLVMGAYGRGKFGSFLFGSTAQHVLKNMTVPVLMSH
ncbi:MAG: universal stress protein [Alphaproteobacteria bacterium]|nr:universal stress protein [Alphaproteobacteria bacterium]